MKSVTEFAGFSLAQGIKAKTGLTAEGKTVEEIQTALGETFKLEGDRLKHFVNAIDVAIPHQEGLKRVLVMSLAEGENAPPKAVQVEAFHYVPELHVHLNRQPEKKSAGDRNGGKRGAGRGGKGGGKDGKKSSPWGEAPEEKAAKAEKIKIAEKGKITPKA